MGEIKALETARRYERPNSKYYIETIFPDFIELCGDRFFGDDPSVIGGIASIDGMPVTVIGQLMGRNTKENLEYNFSMSKPEGFRKILRLMKQAEKFRRPVICFVDTLGAFPGKEAEERGQGNAIVNCLMENMYLRTPIISVLLGHGGSGGALALCIADSIVALENATLSVISPRACANILWKNPTREKEASEMLRIKAKDLLELGVVDRIIPETRDGVRIGPDAMAKAMNQCLLEEINYFRKLPARRLIKRRKKKYNSIGRKYLLDR